MKQLLALIVFVICMSCCEAITSQQFKMLNKYECNFSIEQFDSICNADSISNNLNDWTAVSLRSGETQQVFTEYLYIKNDNYDNEIIYRALKVSDDSINLSKRITTNK